MYLQNGGKRAAVVWHRRSGKDSVGINWTVCDALKNVGTYWHMLPEARQARKVVWDAIDKYGRRVIDQAFPADIRDGKPNDVEMRIRLAQGSIWQCVGSDNYNALVGSNPRGVVFSEYSLGKPAAWDYIRPILAENGGWALFIYTPRGENHGYDLYEMARNNPNWFAQRLTIDDTGVVPQDVIEDERRSGMPEGLIAQEYFCSFTAPLVGSYYGVLIENAEKEGRIRDLPYDPSMPVHTAWDLGKGPHMPIWFFQIAHNEIRVIDYYENDTPHYGFDHYAKILNEKGYNYGWDHVPQDAKVPELGTGRTRVETLISLKRKPRLVPAHKVDDGHNAVRIILPICYFDREKTKQGMKSLKHYQTEWDEDLRKFKDNPLDNWAKHAADAFRYLAMAYRELTITQPPEKGRTLETVTLNDLWDQQRKSKWG